MRRQLDAPPAAPPRAILSRRKRALFTLMAFVFLGVLVEGLAWVATFALPEGALGTRRSILNEQSRSIRELLDTTKRPLTEIHPVLGWRYAPNFKNDANQLNARALRSVREYSPQRPPDGLRIALFGDSMVYGSEVRNAEAWATVMERRDPTSEVLNFGVGGYGVDQAYLRYLTEGVEMDPRIVVLGFTPDDLGRVTNVYRRFISTRDSALFKPRFLIDERGALTYLPPPVRERQEYEHLLAAPLDVRQFRTHDQWYQPCVYDNPFYDLSAALRASCWMGSKLSRKYVDSEKLYRGRAFSESSSAFRINVAVFVAFAEAARARGAFPIALMLPDRESVERRRAGEVASYAPLAAALRQAGVPVVDAAEAFLAGDIGSDLPGLFAPHGHYSAKGSGLVGTWLADAIPREAASPRESTARQP